MLEGFEGVLTSVLHDNVTDANMTKIPINDMLRLITPAPIFIWGIIQSSRNNWGKAVILFPPAA
jgi:hypothetical protein